MGIRGDMHSVSYRSTDSLRSRPAPVVLLRCYLRFPVAIPTSVTDRLRHQALIALFQLHDSRLRPTSANRLLPLLIILYE
jgi:hypothetical protein